MKRDGPVTLASPDHGALEAEFEISRGPEAELLHMHPGIAGINHVGKIGEGLAIGGIWHIGMSAQLADQEVVAEGTVSRESSGT